MSSLIIQLNHLKKHFGGHIMLYPLLATHPLLRFYASVGFSFPAAASASATTAAAAASSAAATTAGASAPAFSFATPAAGSAAAASSAATTSFSAPAFGAAGTAAASTPATAASAAAASASAAGTGAAAAAAAPVQPHLPVAIKGRNVEEIINEWNSELEKQAQSFVKHAGEFIGWVLATPSHICLNTCCQFRHPSSTVTFALIRCPVARKDLYCSLRQPPHIAWPSSAS